LIGRVQRPPVSPESALPHIIAWTGTGNIRCLQCWSIEDRYEFKFDRHFVDYLFLILRLLEMAFEIRADLYLSLFIYAGNCDRDERVRGIW
jgi:hypothetical protein